MTNINISLPESLKSFIDQQIVEGGYNSTEVLITSLTAKPKTYIFILNPI